MADHALTDAQLAELRAMLKGHTPGGVAPATVRALLARYDADTGVRSDEQAMATVERLLRERGVHEVAFTEKNFSGPDKRTYLEQKRSVGRGAVGATLVEAWRRLVGGDRG